MKPKHEQIKIIAAISLHLSQSTHSPIYEKTDIAKLYHLSQWHTAAALQSMVTLGCSYLIISDALRLTIPSIRAHISYAADVQTRCDYFNHAIKDYIKAGQSGIEKTLV